MELQKQQLNQLCLNMQEVVNRLNDSYKKIFSEHKEQIAKLSASATGVDFTREELLRVGERITNVEKAFNSRQGLTRKDDQFSVPEKFTQEPVKDGPFKGCVVELDFMLDDYYDARGWDKKTGLQTRQKMAELGLEHIANELAKTNAIHNNNVDKRNSVLFKFNLFKVSFLYSSSELY